MRDTRVARANTPTTVKLTLSSKAKSALKSALRHGGKGSLAATVTATDPSGNRAVSTLAVSAKKPAKKKKR